MIFVDSSFLISLLLEHDSNYHKARNTWLSVNEETVISEDILKEILTVVSQRKGRKSCIEAYRKIIEENILTAPDKEHFQSGLQLFLNPKLQKDISLIDCISAAICKKLRIKTILTFDRHFRTLGLTVRP